VFKKYRFTANTIKSPHWRVHATGDMTPGALYQILARIHVYSFHHLKSNFNLYIVSIGARGDAFCTA